MNKGKFKLYEIVNKLMYYFMVGWLWVICSLPIFTFGASTAAMHHTIKCIQNNEEGYAISQFFATFKENFKTATRIWLPIMCLMAVSAGAIASMYSSDGNSKYYYAVIAINIVEMLVLIIISAYVFAYITSFEDTVLVSVKNSLIMALNNFIFTTSLVLFDLAIVCCLDWMLFVTIIAPPVLAYVDVKLVETVFRKYR